MIYHSFVVVNVDKFSPSPLYGVSMMSFFSKYESRRVECRRASYWQFTLYFFKYFFLKVEVSPRKREWV